VLDYLGRYIYRVAITNSRLESLADDEEGTVRFRYRDNRTHETKIATLSAQEFINRFLAHVLPDGFTKVRYSGLFSSSNRHRLEFVRKLLAPLPQTLSSPELPPPPLSDRTDSESGSGSEAAQSVSDSARCPHCKVGRLVLLEVIPRPSRREKLP
jgi:hypothetical protein